MKKIVKWLLALGLVGCVLFFGVQFAALNMIPTVQAELKLKEGLSKAGFALEGEIVPTYALRAGVQITLPNLTIHGTEGDLKALRIQSQEVVVMLPISSLWNDFAIQKVYLRGTTITYAPSAKIVNEQNAPISSPVSPAFAKLLLLISSIDPLPYDLHLLDGKILLSDTAQGTAGSGPTSREGAAMAGTAMVNDLSLDLVTRGSGWALSGRGGLHGKTTEIEVSNLPSEADARDIQIKFSNDAFAFAYQGSRSAAVPPLLQGHISFEAEDTGILRQVMTGEPLEVPQIAAVAVKEAEPAPAQDPLSMAAPPPAAAPETPKPALPTAEKKSGALRFTADLFFRQEQVVAKNMELLLPGTRMTGEVGGSILSPYGIKANLEFDTFETSTLASLNGLASENWLPRLVAMGLSERADAAVQIKAPKVEGLIRGENLSTLIELKEGTASIPKFSLQATGGGAISFDGGFAVTPQGPTLMGTLQAQGDSFNQFLPALTSLPITLPPQAFGPFVIASDIRVSPEDIRLSNLRAKVNETVLNAAYIHQFSNKDTGIRLAVSELDVDSLLRSEAASGMLFRLNEKASKTQIMPVYLQEMLLGLRANYNIYLSAENYIYDGQPRDPLEIRLRASRGRVDLDSFKTRLNGADVSFVGFADISASVPKFKLDMTLGDLDVLRFEEWAGLSREKPTAPSETSATPAATAEIQTPPGGRWSNAALNWNFIPLADGVISIKAARVLHPELTLSNANLNFRIADEQLYLDDSSATLFNADLRAKGQLGGGALPSWQGSFSVANLEVAEMQRLLPWMKSVQGRISISGAVASSGASELAQIRNLKANLAATGRAIQINEFDLAGVVELLRRTSSVDNLKSDLDEILPRSNTRFDTLEGTVQVNLGAITIPRIVMRSNRFIGEVTGSGSVTDWQLDAQTSFPLSVVNQAKPPALLLVAKGPLDAPVITRDERALEQYVVQKSAAEMIQTR